MPETQGIPNLENGVFCVTVFYVVPHFLISRMLSSGAPGLFPYKDCSILLVGKHRGRTCRCAGHLFFLWCGPTPGPTGDPHVGRGFWQAEGGLQQVV